MPACYCDNFTVSHLAMRPSVKELLSSDSKETLICVALAAEVDIAARECGRAQSSVQTKAISLEDRNADNQTAFSRSLPTHIAFSSVTCDSQILPYFFPQCDVDCVF